MQPSNPTGPAPSTRACRPFISSSSARLREPGEPPADLEELAESLLGDGERLGEHADPAKLRRQPDEIALVLRDLLGEESVGAHDTALGVGCRCRRSPGAPSGRRDTRGSQGRRTIGTTRSPGAEPRHAGSRLRRLRPAPRGRRPGGPRRRAACRRSRTGRSRRRCRRRRRRACGAAPRCPSPGQARPAPPRRLRRSGQTRRPS